MAKFKVGDRARVRYVRNKKDDKWRPGIEVSIVSLQSGVSSHNNPYDCIVMLDSGENALPSFDQLEPIIDLGSWDELQKTINWNPTKELNHVE